MKIQCVRRLQFCSGHRVLGHENKCANVHGHNYVLFVHAEAPELDGLGRVIDFSVLKEKVGGWIDKNWDHTFIAFKQDLQLAVFVGTQNKKPVYLLPDNPTAENMAKHLLEIICPDILRDTGVTVTKIVLWETENCYATAEL